MPKYCYSNSSLPESNFRIINTPTCDINTLKNEKKSHLDGCYANKQPKFEIKTKIQKLPILLKNEINNTLDDIKECIDYHCVGKCCDKILQNEKNTL